MAEMDPMAAILAGLAHVPRWGTPGVLETTPGGAATGVLSTDSGQVIIAASEVGAGRIVVATHNGYLQGISQGVNQKHESKQSGLEKLQTNMANWASRNGSSDGKVLDLKAVKSGADVLRQEVKLATWHGGNMQKVRGLAEQVDLFVERGGGLLYAICPWGWLQNHPKLSLEDLPFYSLLQRAGISFTSEVARGHAEGFYIRPSSTADCDLVHQSTATKVPQDDCQPTQLKCTKMKNDSWTSHRQDLLSDITDLPRLGAPGRVVVYGEHARAIISVSDSHQVLLAAAVIGSGRLLVLSHNGYVNQVETRHDNENVAKLQKNMKQWVSQGAWSEKSKCGIHVLNKHISPKDIASAGTHVLVWRGEDLSAQTQQHVRDHVIKGGGLIIAITPWGWLQLHPNNALQDMPLSSLLYESGISFTADCMTDGSFNLTDDYDMEGDNVTLALSAVCHERSSIENCGKCLMRSLRWCPMENQDIDRNLRQLAEIYSDNLADSFPSKKHPIKNDRDKALMAICQGLNERNIGFSKMPGICSFPGDFDESPTLQCAKVCLTADNVKTVHPLGYYAPAGHQLKVKTTLVSPGVEKKKTKWKLTIGVHSDDLGNKDELSRWPGIVTTLCLDCDDWQTVTSPYGGLLHVSSPPGGSSMEISLEGVVESPRYDVCNDDSKKDWSRRRHSPGLWADISGRFISFSLPSKSIQDLEDPAEALNLWDRVVEAHHHLRGTDVRDLRKQWVVPDVQPSAGYMHSGYPIVTHMDVADPKHENFLLSVKCLKTGGAWGMYHELGHNMQRPAWTFDGTGEVTVNIFTLHAMNVVSEQPVWIHKWLANQMKGIEKYLKNGADFQKWKKSPGIALGIYAQLAHHFGWGVYKQVFREYETDIERLNKLPNKKKMDSWVERMSAATGHNLCPLFEFWGFAIDEELKQSVEKNPDLIAWLPVDEMTNYVKERAADIARLYKGCVREVDMERLPTYNFR